MILFTVTLIAYIFNTVFNLLALFKAKNKKQTIKSDTTDTPLYILMIVNFLLVPDIMFNVTITIINLVNILLDTFRFIRTPLNNKSLLIKVTINISYILLSFLLLGCMYPKKCQNCRHWRQFAFMSSLNWKIVLKLKAIYNHSSFFSNLRD